MTHHVFGEPERRSDFNVPITTCKTCGVIRLKDRGVFHYYGREHMGTGHHACPAPFAACGTEPDWTPKNKPLTDAQVSEFGALCVMNRHRKITPDDLLVEFRETLSRRG